MLLNYLIYKTKIFKVWKNFLFYQCPINLEYFWNFGSLATLYLVSQFVSGLLLVFWYIPHVDLAFQSVEFIMREVHYGWLIRYIHANGASFFFISLYFHIARNIFFGSYLYPREKVWLSGMVIFILTILTAFFGYVLPWGQMSYWAATVISNLTSVIPVIGESLLIYLWGGLFVGQPTLTRIYGLHFLLPFIILSFVIIHIYFLYEFGSNNPLGCKTLDNIPFYPYFIWKDIYGIIICLILYIYIIFYVPNKLGHSDNYIVANIQVTPSHIVPEWYFLPFYGLLRSVPSKAGGVLCLVCAILVLFLLPYCTTAIFIRSGYFRPIFQLLYFLFIFIYFFLGWIGGKPIEYPYYLLCQLFTFYYFFFFYLNSLLFKYEQFLYRQYLLKKNYSIEFPKISIRWFIKFYNIYTRFIKIQLKINLFFNRRKKKKKNSKSNLRPRPE